MSPHPTTVERACEYCGQIFYPLAAQVRRNRGRFCSRTCRSRVIRRPILDRFWSKVNKSGECWIWTGTHLPHGYGQFGIPKRGNCLAHRVSYEIAYGPIPDGMVIGHHCDNPSCVRPDHLFAGSQAENLADMRTKGRSATGDRSSFRKHPEIIRRGEQSNLAILSTADVLVIRALSATKQATRQQIAIRFGVKRETIGKIVRGERWRHLL